MRRAKVHISGIAEYRNAGTIVTRDKTHWRIEDDEGRAFYSPASDSTGLGIQIG
jgi:post-segregation antitoxin (ccd killing protein)